MTVPWPTKTENPVKIIARDPNNIQVEDDTYRKPSLMADGYKAVADKAIDHLLNKNSEFDRYRMAFPILFNYRHYIEIRLKNLIQKYSQIVTIPAIKTDHRLMPLWNAYKEILAQIVPINARDLNAEKGVERIIQQFSLIDPDSFYFRYATTKGGEVIELKLKYFNAEHLKRTMDNVESFLVGVTVT